MEKGGKGGGLKSSLKSAPAILNEGSPQAGFDFSKSNGKFRASAGKGSLGRGGKGEKTASVEKIPTTKEPQPLELKIEQELPQNAECLMDCEAAQILQGVQEQMVLLSRDPTIKLPMPFDRGLQYAKKGAHYTNPQAVKRVLETLKKHGASDGEICVISNVCPETVDEVFALVPSLKPKWSQLREPLKDVLGHLAKLKKPAP